MDNNQKARLEIPQTDQKEENHDSFTFEEIEKQLDKWQSAYISKLKRKPEYSIDSIDSAPLKMTYSNKAEGNLSCFLTPKSYSIGRSGTLDGFLGLNRGSSSKIIGCNSESNPLKIDKIPEFNLLPDMTVHGVTSEIPMIKQEVEEVKFCGMAENDEPSKIKVNWKDDLVQDIVNLSKSMSANQIYSHYKFKIPLRTIFRWISKGLACKNHKKKGKRTQLKPLELLLFEWFLWQRTRGF